MSRRYFTYDGTYIRDDPTWERERELLPEEAARLLECAEFDLKYYCNKAYTILNEKQAIYNHDGKFRLYRKIEKASL